MFCYSARATEMNQRCELLNGRTAVLSSTQLDGAQNLVMACVMQFCLPLIEIKARGSSRGCDSYLTRH